MQIKGMDPALIEIYNIRNLESVNIWDMRLNAEHGTLIVPAIMIVYDGGKTLNLSSKDKYFTLYAKKVMQVYEDEKNNILEDGLTDPFKLASTIKIDDDTKRILESGSLIDVNEILRFYEGKEAYEASLLYQEDEVKAIMPIVRYHVERLFGITDKAVLLGDNITGYRDRYVVTGEVLGIEKSIPFIFDKISPSVYEVHIGGLLEKNLPVRTRISFGKDSIEVSVFIEPYGLEQVSSYKITNGNVKGISDVTKRGITISYVNEDLEMGEFPFMGIANIDETVNMQWYKLPWNAYYGVNTQIQSISEYEKMIELHNMYVDVGENRFFKQEFFSKAYKRNATVSVKADEIVLLDVSKRQLGVTIDNEDKIYVVETLFNDETLDNISSLDKGRYFYHGCYTNEGIKGINESSLVSLTRDKSIVRNSDLLNKYKLLKYIKGGK